jgi:hypothetical protein
MQDAIPLTSIPASRPVQRLRVVFRGVIKIDEVQACRRLAQAHLIRLEFTELDRCPLQNLGIARLPNLHRVRHQGFHKSIIFLPFVREDREFYKFIIITIILPLSHDSAIHWETF